MSENTAIEWADHTFNPWIGCTKISPACDHCYAERWDNRLHQGKHWGSGAERQRTSQSNWAQPLKWNHRAAAKGTRYRVFCASLADVFDNEVSPEWWVDLLDLIRQTPHLDWLLLTKRIGAAPGRISQAERAAETGERFDLSDWLGSWMAGDPPANVWLGATVVNQEEVDRDVPKLLFMPAAVRFVSCEPLLGAVDLSYIDDGAAHREIPREHWGPLDDDECPPGLALDALTGMRRVMLHDYEFEGTSLDWVIVGGESGPQTRPSHPDWFRSLRDQCVAAGVPFLFKQWGEWVSEDDLDNTDLMAPQQSDPDDFFRRHTFEDRHTVWRVGKKAAGRHLDGRTWDQFPEPAA